MILLFLVFVTTFASCEPKQKTNTSEIKTDDYLILFFSEEDGTHRYEDIKGNIVIPPDKYEMIFTDTFKTMAIVLTKNDWKFLGIDRNENILFEIFSVDNGPDYVEDGLFRIIKDGKIGYADLDGNIIIEPQFKCAFAFDNGFAEVSNDCWEEQTGEYTLWKSNNWITIDTIGNVVE